MNTRTDQDLQLGKLVAGAALGALAMYLLDPERGAHRRSAAADTLRDIQRDSARALSGAVQDLSHRSGAAEVFHASDTDHVAAEAPAGRAALLGGGLLGLLGLLNRRSPLALAAGLAGAAMLAGGLRRQSLAGLLSTGAGHGVIEIERTIRIDASPEQVYDLWANVDNFPCFMANVSEVRDLGANLSRWVVKGPAGRSYEWNSILTEQSRPRRLAWRSIPGSEIAQSGEVRLDPFNGGTRATIRLRYAPPAGLAGQALAALLGSNPKAQLDDDLQRMKNLLEKGSPLHGASHLGGSDSKFLH